LLTLREVLAVCAAAVITVSFAYVPSALSGETLSRGRILFLKCASCHDVSASTSAKIGPNLYGVVGRRVAAQEGYPYSEALRAQDFTWDILHLDQWLTNPNAVAPGTAMAFAGIPDAADRRQIIAYLQAQSTSNGPGPKVGQ
jgi:cytochrome c